MIGNKKVIAMCVSRLHDTENNQFISVFNELLRKENCTLFIYNISTELSWNEKKLRAETHIFDLIDNDITDAVVIMNEKIKSDTVLEKIVEKSNSGNVPVIIVDGQHSGCSSVRFDYATGFEKMVRHVIEHHGVKKVKFMSGLKGNPFSDEREEIFKRVALENGIKVDSSMIHYGDFWAGPATEEAEKIYASGDIPEAIICANDIMAINVCEVFAKHGIKVPEQLIVTGFDGIPEINYYEPKITSVKTSSIELAEATFKVVMDHICGNTEPCERLVSPTMLINRSCGCSSDEEEEKGIINKFNSHFYHYQDDNVILNDMADNMQTVNDIDGASLALDNKVINDMCCIINKECVDDSIDYFHNEISKSFSDDMFLFFDKNNIAAEHREFDRKCIVPDLEEKVQSGYPLIFNCISYMNKPLGYICFNFKHYDITEYCKLMYITSAVGRGVGGWINMRYQRHLVEYIENMYMYDGLTGLYNRISFSKKIKERISSVPSGTPLSVVLADLDGLKNINDNYGHFSGDNAISTVANALKLACPPDSICVRYGGDEMIAFVFGNVSIKDIVRRIRRTLNEYNSNSGLNYDISASIGAVKTHVSSEINKEALIKSADKLMYSEKRRKKKSK